MSATPRLKSLLDALAADLSRPTRIAGRDALSRRIQRALEPLRPTECPPYGTVSAARGHGEYLTHLSWALERPDESGYVGLALSVECGAEPTRDGLLTALYPVLDVHAERRLLVATIRTRGLADATLTHHVLKDVRRLVARHRGMAAKDRLGLVLREPSGGRVACWIVRGDGRAKPYLPRPVGRTAGQEDTSAQASSPAAPTEKTAGQPAAKEPAKGRAADDRVAAVTVNTPAPQVTPATAKPSARAPVPHATRPAVEPTQRVVPTERVASSEA